MSSSLQRDLRQQKPFTSPEQEAHLNIVRTGTMLVDAFEQRLRPYGLSATQYNVLRILRGAEPAGLCRNELRDRLLTRMPDVTRLLDRMEEAGLVTRSRDCADRRLVTTRITAEARRLVDELDAVAVEEHQRCLGHLSREQLATLVELLTLIRQAL